MKKYLSFQSLADWDGFVFIHTRNFQILAAEMLKDPK